MHLAEKRQVLKEVSRACHVLCTVKQVPVTTFLNTTSFRYPLQDTKTTIPGTIGEHAKLRKATLSFVLSVRPHETVRLQLVGFS